MSINSILEKRNKFQQTVETTSNFDFEFYGIEDDFTRSELLKKDFVYREIQRYKIFLKYHNDKIKELSVRTIKYISSNEIPEEQVIEIIEAEEPSKKIDEIEKSLKNGLTSEEKINVLEVKIIQARKKILKWEEEIKKLRR